MKLTSKFQPFIENIVIGSLFIVLGRYIMVTFNESAFGFVGLVAMFWGGFKVFIGVVIYGVALWARLFRPESFIGIKEDRTFVKIMKRVEADMRSNDFSRAIDRLHGGIMKNPNNTKFKFELAELYLQKQDMINAGRYLYLKLAVSEKESECIAAFEGSNGGDAFHILRKITKPSKIDRNFVNEAKDKLIRLVHQARKGAHKNSWIVRAYSAHLDAVNIPFYKKIWRDERDIVIHVGVLIGLYCLTEILKS